MPCCRFELREDRKREALRSTGNMDNLRRDIRQSFMSLSPAMGQRVDRNSFHSSYPQPPGLSLGHGSSVPLSGQGLLSPEELEQLKRELVAELKDEVRMAAKQMMASCLCNGMIGGGVYAGGGVLPVPQAVPQLTSDLYHTHLYTQL